MTGGGGEEDGGGAAEVTFCLAELMPDCYLFSVLLTQQIYQEEKDIS